MKKIKCKLSATNRWGARVLPPTIYPSIRSAKMEIKRLKDDGFNFSYQITKIR